MLLWIGFSSKWFLPFNFPFIIEYNYNPFEIMFKKPSYLILLDESGCRRRWWICQAWLGSVHVCRWPCAVVPATSLTPSAPPYPTFPIFLWPLWYLFFLSFSLIIWVILYCNQLHIFLSIYSFKLRVFDVHLYSQRYERAC